jgi:hypothetical protein
VLARRRVGATQLPGAQALELEDLQHDHEIDAGGNHQQPERDHHERPAELELAVVV